MGTSPISNCAQMGHEIWKVWIQKPLRKERHRDYVHKIYARLRTFCKKKTPTPNFMKIRQPVYTLICHGREDVVSTYNILPPPSPSP